MQWQDENACLQPDSPGSGRQIATQRQRLVEHCLGGIAEGLVGMLRRVRQDDVLVDDQVVDAEVIGSLSPVADSHRIRADRVMWKADADVHDGSGPPGLAAYISGGARPGAEDANGEYVPPIRVQLVRDSHFTKFERMMAAATSADSRAESNSDETVYHRVTATFVGRIDAVSPEIHAFHQKRSPADKADYLGFGQMGLYDAQLVVKSVENGATLETLRFPASPSKKQ